MNRPTNHRAQRVSAFGLASVFSVVCAASVVVSCGGDDANVKKEEAVKHRTPPDEPWRKDRPAAGPSTEIAFPTFQSETLGTGLTVMVVAQPSLPIVQFGFVSQYGSMSDNPKAPGMASLVYDMLDEGAGTMNAVQLAEAFGKVGTELYVSSGIEDGRIGAGVLKRNLATAMELVSTVVLKPTFDKDRFEKVRAERLSSITARRGQPQSMVMETMFEAAFGAEHPYGMRSVGTPDSVGKAKVADLKKLWADNVGPANSALVFAGDITMDEAKALAEKHFGKWKSKAKRPAPPKDPAPAKSVIHVVKGAKGSPQTVMALGRPLLAQGAADEIAVDVMNQILGGMFSSRLNMKLREEKRWTYGAWSFVDARLGKGPFLAGASVVAPETANALKETLTIFDTLANAPVSDEELALAKANIVKSLPSKLETVGALSSAAASLYLAGKPLDYFATLAEKVNAVTKEDVQAAAVKALNKDGLSIVLAGDADVLAPALADIREVVVIEAGAAVPR